MGAVWKVCNFVSLFDTRTTPLIEYNSSYEGKKTILGRFSLDQPGPFHSLLKVHYTELWLWPQVTEARDLFGAIMGAFRSEFWNGFKSHLHT